MDKAYELTPDEGLDDAGQHANLEPRVFGGDDPDDDDYLGEDSGEDEDGAESEYNEDSDSADSPEVEGAQTSDVVGEADIYIAYGRYPQALALLNSAIEKDPSRAEVRLKLLEIYAETEDQAMFDNHMQVLIDTCDDEDSLLQARDISTPFGTDEQDYETDDIDPGEDPADDEDAQESDDFDLELDEEDVEAVEETGDTDEVDIEEDEQIQEIAEEEESDAEKPGGDLGMDFNPGEQLTEIRELDSEEFDLDELELDESDLDSEFIVEQEANDGGDATDDAFEFLDEEDASSTKLDLARAYIDMGDEDGAREILAEVVGEGSEEQQSQANELLAQLK